MCLVDFTAAATAGLSTTVEELEKPEDTYLPIIAGGPAKDPAAAQPDMSR